MKVVQKKLDGGKILVSAVASTAEVSRAFNAAHLAFAQQMGLRPEKGKTVAQVAEERLGIRDLDSVVSSQAIEALMPFAVDQTGTSPAFPPRVSAQSPLKRGQTFTFELTLTPKPDYELDSYEPVRLSFATVAVDEAEVDAQIKQMAENYAQYVADNPRPVAKGDCCKLSMEVHRQNGEKVKPLCTTGRTYATGQGYMPEGFDEAIVGMKVGETKTFSFNAPDIDEAGNQITSLMTATVTVLEQQKRVVPTIDDEWVKKFMPFYKDAESLRKGIRDNLGKQREKEQIEALREAAAAQVASRFSGSIPDEVYEESSRTLVSNMRREVSQQGMTWEQFIEQQGGEQQLNMMLMLQTRQMLVQGYALDAVFRHEKLAITDEDLSEVCATMGGQDPSTIRRQLEESGRGFVLREAAERLRANKWLVEHAINTDEAES